MQRITIGRYKLEPSIQVDGVPDVSEAYDGWVEGVRDDGSTWIMWLDANGNPEVFWPHRDADGDVEGEPVSLTL